MSLIERSHSKTGSRKQDNPRNHLILNSSSASRLLKTNTEGWHVLNVGIFSIGMNEVSDGGAAAVIPT